MGTTSDTISRTTPHVTTRSMAAQGMNLRTSQRGQVALLHGVGRVGAAAGLTARRASGLRLLLRAEGARIADVSDVGSVRPLGGSAYVDPGSSWSCGLPTTETVTASSTAKETTSVSPRSVCQAGLPVLGGADVPAMTAARSAVATKPTQRHGPSGSRSRAAL